MNWAHLHLVSNHLPVLGTMFALGLLGWGMLRRNESVQRVALGTFVIMALLVLPAYFTGEPAEDIVEHAVGVGESSIEAHEAAALVSFIGVEIVGFLALITLFRARGGRSLSMVGPRVVLTVAIATAGVLAWTANLGGQIRHAEIRPGAAAPAQVEVDERGGP
jgi:uncharacterized membrane protein